MCQVGILVIPSVLSRSPVTSSYFIHVREFKPRETTDLPKVTQGENSKVRRRQSLQGIAPPAACGDGEVHMVLASQ